MTGLSSTSFGAEVFTVASREIDAHWHWIEPHLRRVESPTWTLEHVKSELQAARAQLWSLLVGGSPSGVLITRIENSGAVRFGLIWIAAGSGIEPGRALLHKVEQWFREQGCRYIEINGRRGWERVLEDYELKAVVLVKKL